MRKFVLCATLLCVAAFADVDSSIDIPYGKHQKYTLGNQKNHPTIRLEGERYFASLAKLSKDEIKKRYKELAHKYHPDINNGEDTKMKELNHYRDILMKTVS